MRETNNFSPKLTSMAFRKNEKRSLNPDFENYVWVIIKDCGYRSRKQASISAPLSLQGALRVGVSGGANRARVAALNGEP